MVMTQARPPGTSPHNCSDYESTAWLPATDIVIAAKASIQGDRCVAGRWPAAGAGVAEDFAVTLDREAGFAFQGGGFGFDALFDEAHDLAARPSRRDRRKKAQDDAAGPLGEATAAPEQAGIDRSGYQGHVEGLVERRHPGLVDELCA